MKTEIKKQCPDCEGPMWYDYADTTYNCDKCNMAYDADEIDDIMEANYNLEECITTGN